LYKLVILLCKGSAKVYKTLQQEQEIHLCFCKPHIGLSRVFLARVGAVCACSLKGRVWPSLPANASDRKDSFSKPWVQALIKHTNLCQKDVGPDKFL
jgi:hypothetical protein